MDAIASLKEGLQVAHWVVEGTIDGLTPDQLHKPPGGSAHPIGALYAHLVGGEDMMVNQMMQGKPMIAMSQAGKGGLSELPPVEGGDWSQWAKTVRVDLPALRAYAQAVYASSDAYLSSLKPEDLDKKVEFFGPDIGPQSLNWFIQAVIGHANNHIGEISALKGVQGLKGYPF